MLLEKLTTAFGRCKPERLLLIVGIGGLISLLISNGVTIQRVFFALLFGQDARTLYEALFDNCVSRFPSLVEWLAESLNPLFLGLSFIISAVVVLSRSGSFQRLLMAAWVATFVGLSTLDAVWMIWHGIFTVSSWFQNLVGNLLGGLLVALVVATAIAGTMRLFRYSNVQSRWRPLITVGVAWALGIVSSVFLHVILTAVLHPLPADIRISSSLPTESITVSAACSSAEEEWPRFIPEEARIEKLHVKAVDDLEVRWNKAQEQSIYSLSMYAVHGCSRIADLEEIERLEPLYFHESLHNVRVLSELGLGDLFVNGKQTGVSVYGSPVKILWLDRDGEESTVDIQQFLAEDISVQARTSGSFSAMITATLLESVEGTTVATPKQFSVFIDDREKQVTFAPAPKNELPDPLECRILPTDIKGPDTIQFDSQWLAGLYLRIERMGSPARDFHEFDGSLSLIDPKGWLDVSGIDQSHTCSNIGRISIEDATGRMEIGGNSEELPGDQAFHGYGDVSLSYSKEGSLLLQGEYDAAWLGARRLNQTRYDVGPLELIVLVLVPLGFLVAWPRKWIRDEWLVNERDIFRALLRDGN